MRAVRGHHLGGVDHALVRHRRLPARSAPRCAAGVPSAQVATRALHRGTRPGHVGPNRSSRRLPRPRLSSGAMNQHSGSSRSGSIPMRRKVAAMSSSVSVFRIASAKAPCPSRSKGNRAERVERALHRLFPSVGCRSGSTRPNRPAAPPAFSVISAATHATTLSTRATSAPQTPADRGRAPRLAHPRHGPAPRSAPRRPRRYRRSGCGASSQACARACRLNGPTFISSTPQSTRCVPSSGRRPAECEGLAGGR